MKNVLTAAAIVLVAFVAAVPGTAFAGSDNKTVKGAVSAVGADSVTIKVDAQEMTFKITAKTKIIARGGSPATRQAQQQGTAGPKLGDMLQANDEIQVTYSEDAGVMTAHELRVTKKATK